MPPVRTHQPAHSLLANRILAAPGAAAEPPVPEINPAGPVPPDPVGDPIAAAPPARSAAGPQARPVVDEVLDVRAVTSLVFESYRDGEQWRWRLRADGFRLLAESDAAFATMRDCERGIVIVRAQARFAHTHLRQDPDGQWRWWLLGGGGRVLARSAVAYSTRFACAMEIGLLRHAIGDAVSLRSVGGESDD
jgi:uncharacterized protein YegP (UPF0339 family)